MTYKPPQSDADRLVQQILTGDVDPDSPEVRELLDAQPQIRDELVRLRGLATRLEHVGELERRDLSEAVGQPTPFEDQVPGIIDRARAEGGLGARPRNPRRVVYGLLAAAALLIPYFGINTWLGGSAGDTDLNNTVLGSEEQGEMKPTGECRSFAQFTWTFEDHATTSFEVRVYDGPPEGRLPIETSRLLDAQSWQPPKDRNEKWNHIWWRLYRVLPGQEYEELGTAEVRLRR